MPHFQDFPALLAMAEEGDISETSVFFPGHVPGRLRGTHVPAHFLDYEKSREDKVLEDILRVQYKFWPLSRLSKRGGVADAVVEKIRTQSRFPGTANEWKQVTRYEMRDAESRQAQYIINSCRAYEFLGARWRTLWDYSLMDFFLKVPLEYREEKRLYLQALRKRIFTGPAGRLAAIPIEGLGGWTSDLHLRPIKWKNTLSFTKVKAKLRSILAFMGVERLARNSIHPKTVPYLNRFDCVFAGGKEPCKVKVSDVFEAYGTWEKIPRFLYPMIRPRLKDRIDLVYFKAPLAAVSLGELAAIPAKTIGTNY